MQRTEWGAGDRHRKGWRGVEKSPAVPLVSFMLVSKTILCLKEEVTLSGFGRHLCAHNYS